ncbi:hypothetical protein [Spongiactinospora sp. TRM90649]|uniref:hypothetical protein n=1 Tax=Spongiactinospora sp. TRM90649 TaxID=3031114 RepID=UPI0023F73689|nr:hypothetical protein [Spongiactinospora sp. TRM90649]MDF5753100.1 hypothetical protein [Spongiactinospora sp. TRM90649]
MTARLTVADIRDYLASTGWALQPDGWRGGTIWVHAGDHEILVPGSDDLGDGPRRVRDILVLLARLEGRAREHIAADIGAPMADVQWYRAPIVPSGEGLGLIDAVTAFTSARDALSAVARAALHGPRPAFGGAAPREVRDLLDRTVIGPIVPSDDVLTVRVPLDRDKTGGDPLARRTLLLFQRTAALLWETAAEAERTGDIGVFDGVVREGVSAELCAALAQFAGPGDGGRFEIGFRWARGLPAEIPASNVVFDGSAGRLLRRVAHRLRRLHRDTASVTGLITSLFDNGDVDRFRVHVKGEVLAENGEPRGSIWVRLPDEPAYDLAVDAHRNRSVVRAHGTLMEVHGRLELRATGFERSSEET